MDDVLPQQEQHYLSDILLDFVAGEAHGHDLLGVLAETPACSQIRLALHAQARDEARHASAFRSLAAHLPQTLFP